MKDHGTLFKADMVRALFREVDPKTQTRRLFTRHNSLVDGRRATPALWADLDFDAAWVDAGPSPAGNVGPYLKVPRRSEGTVHRVYATISPGDRLWGRETWNRTNPGGSDGVYYYRADTHFPESIGGGPIWSDAAWRPAIHMPRAASRILLAVNAVRIQRLQEISEADAIAEGIERNWSGDLTAGPNGYGGEGWVPECGWRHYLNSMDGDPAYTAVESYRSLWEKINGASSWSTNPWVRVYEFMRIAS